MTSRAESLWAPLSREASDVNCRLEGPGAVVLEPRWPDLTCTTLGFVASTDPLSSLITLSRNCTFHCHLAA